MPSIFCILDLDAVYLFFLTARPGAWRGSRFRRDLFFKPRKAVSCFASGLFFFLVLSVTRRRPLPLGQVLCRHRMMS